jgi:lipid-A-disaccharide synthase-like uncharacterized protein
MMLTYEKIWAGVGLLGQGVFTARFLVQWIASERKRATVVPVAFWWLSLTGGLITLTYAIYLGSLAFTLGQSLGLFVYIRNLMLEGKARRQSARRSHRGKTDAAATMARPHRLDAPGRDAARI